MNRFTKDAICELLDIKAELVVFKIFAALSFVTGSIIESTVLEMLGASFAGAIMMGYAFAYLMKSVNAKRIGQRWLVNICFGIPLGLFGAYKYKDLFPGVPGWVVSGAFSGLAGPLAVFVILIGGPHAKDFFLLYLDSLKRKIPNLPTPSFLNGQAPDSNTGNQATKRGNPGSEQVGARENPHVPNLPNGGMVPVEPKKTGSRRD